jgi:hypothetical protein
VLLSGGKTAFDLPLKDASIENVKLFLRKTIQLLESLFRKDVLNILIQTTVLCKRFSDNWNVEQNSRK